MLPSCPPPTPQASKKRDRKPRAFHRKRSEYSQSADTWGESPCVSPAAASRGTGPDTDTAEWRAERMQLGAGRGSRWCCTRCPQPERQDLRGGLLTWEVRCRLPSSAGAATACGMTPSSGGRARRRSGRCETAGRTCMFAVSFKNSGRGKKRERRKGDERNEIGGSFPESPTDTSRPSEGAHRTGSGRRHPAWTRTETPANQGRTERPETPRRKVTFLGKEPNSDFRPVDDISWPVSDSRRRNPALKLICT